MRRSLALAFGLLLTGCASGAPPDETPTQSAADRFPCSFLQRVRGECVDTEALASESPVIDLDAACAGSNSADLCQAMRDGNWSQARDLAAAEVAADRGAAVTDSALRYFVRERMVANFIWDVVTDFGANRLSDDDYANAADDALKLYYPVYDSSQFAMAHTQLAPRAADTTCSSPREALLFYPGVIRTWGRHEFANQIAYMNEKLPCLHTELLETGSFVATQVNAKIAVDQLAKLDQRYGALPLHLLGYSQGSSNVLRTLTDYPEVAARVKSVLTFDSAAHGSEVAEAMYSVVSGIANGQSGCDGLWTWLQPACRAIFAVNPTPEGLMREIVARPIGIPVEQLGDWIAQEDDIATVRTLDEFLIKHAPGVQSLTVAAANEFWAGDAQRLPTTPLYTSFRAVITDAANNLPSSNSLFYKILKYNGGNNDMQVRVVNQALGGPVAGSEVVMPLAEGNHWQWELNPGALSEDTMPNAMVERIPQKQMFLAYYTTLLDIGLLQ